jgi:hypothetical protein
MATIDKVEQSLEKARMYLKEITAKHNGYMLCRADSEFIKMLKNSLKDYVSAQARMINERTLLNGKISVAGTLEDNLRTYSFCEVDQRILDKICAHSGYFMENGKIGYSIDSKIYSPIQTSMLIGTLTKPGKLPSGRSKEIVRFQYYISRSDNLSGKQVCTIEDSLFYYKNGRK